MILSLSIFENIFLEIETVAFTALIFTQYALTLSEVLFYVHSAKLNPYSNDNIECGICFGIRGGHICISEIVIGF